MHVKIILTSPKGTGSVELTIKETLVLGSPPTNNPQELVIKDRRFDYNLKAEGDDPREAVALLSGVNDLFLGPLSNAVAHFKAKLIEDAPLPEEEKKELAKEHSAYCFFDAEQQLQNLWILEEDLQTVEQTDDAQNTAPSETVPVAEEAPVDPPAATDEVSDSSSSDSTASSDVS